MKQNCRIHTILVLLELHRSPRQSTTRKPSCRWQTRATQCNVIVASWRRNA